ncbi:TVP38/TMEM64 family protein [Gordoniibacillus kamchatkensis]|uniref:TVP38/TMEM64 family protein n=1 Tax=Gordoniibacillus kamchatkensis TaxID=1590651 RepID=UPI000697C023|nr:VTT domain-containing protein [Paenibacillus sp. VKM B-2647]
MIKKGAVLFLYGTGIVFIIAYKELILSWLTNGDTERLPWLIGIAILLAAAPVVPFGIVAGIMGAQYGPIWGTLINVASSTVAGAIQFLAVRVLFQEWGRHFVMKFERMDRFLLFLERNAFLAVLTARLLPFVPAPAVNAAAAISQMSFGSFFLATLIGKIPVMVMFSVIGGQLFFSLSQVAWTLVMYVLFLIAIYACYRWYHMTKFSQQQESDTECITKQEGENG